MAGTVTLGGLASNLNSGSKTIGPMTDTGTAIIGSISDASLSSGDNSFAIPSGAVRVVIALGSLGVTATVKFRTNLDVTGVALTPYVGNAFATMPLPSTATSVVLNASTSVTGVELSFI